MLTAVFVALAVGLDVWVKVLVNVDVWLAVPECVLVSVELWVNVFVNEKVVVKHSVGVNVSVGENVSVFVKVNVLVNVSVFEKRGVAVYVGVCVSVPDCVGVAEKVAVAVGVCVVESAPTVTKAGPRVSDPVEPKYVTDAELERGPGVALPETWMEKWIVRVPIGRVPTFQVTNEPASTPAGPETNVSVERSRADGSASVMTTPLAGDRPVFARFR